MERTVCVTGAGGYIASWIVCELLRRGYTVHGTVRNLDDDAKSGHLKRLDGAADRLKLFNADVLDYDAIAAAVRGCTGVFHTVCPIIAKSDSPDEILVPAVEGTQNVMKACSEENVKRVVLTSSGVAVVADPNRPPNKMVDESCWSDVEHCRKNKMWYHVAKTESEKLAWELAKEYKLELTSLCPVIVFGPFLQSVANASVLYLKNIMTGSTYQNGWIRVIDVRDTAEAHVAAFENPATISERFIASGHVLEYRTIIDTLKDSFPDYSYPDKCEGDKPQGIPPNMSSNEKFEGLLGKEPIPYKQTLVDSVKCFQEKGLL